MIDSNSTSLEGESADRQLSRPLLYTSYILVVAAIGTVTFLTYKIPTFMTAIGILQSS